MALGLVDFARRSFKDALVFRITKFNIKNSVPLKTVHSNITIDGLQSFKLWVVVKIKMKQIYKIFFQKPSAKMFYILAWKAIGDIRDFGKNMRMRVTHRFKFEMGLSPRMHQINNRYNPNGYGSLQVTPIACVLEVPKRHGIKHGFFIHLHPS